MELMKLFENLQTNPESVFEKMMTEYNRCPMRKMFKDPNPRVDLYPVDNGLELKADLPGMEKENINLTIQNDQLILSGERQSVSDRSSENWYRSERYFGKFTRTFPLPFEAEPDKVTAKFDNGVLTAFIPHPNPYKQQYGKVQIQ